MASELGAYGIRVNAVAPGLIHTKMLMDEDAEAVELLRNNTYLKRIGQPEDVAMMAAYLASEEAAYVTGQVICVDGGM